MAQEELEHERRGQSTRARGSQGTFTRGRPPRPQNLNIERGLSSSLSLHVTKSMAGKRVAAKLTSTLAEKAYWSGRCEGLEVGGHVIGPSPPTTSCSNSGSATPPHCPQSPPLPNGAARAPHWALARTKDSVYRMCLAQGPVQQWLGLL